jgi:hypothetical protein
LQKALSSHQLKHSYSASSLYPIEEGSQQAGGQQSGQTSTTTSHNATRVHSRMHSKLDRSALSGRGEIGNDDEHDGGDKEKKVGEFEYGDEHLYIMDNSLPSFAHHMETIMNQITVNMVVSSVFAFFHAFSFSL